MLSNDELYARSDLLPAFADEYTTDDIELANEIVARFREDYESTLATEQAGDEPIDEAWLREIGFLPYNGGGIMHREGLLADLLIRSHGRGSWTLLCRTGRLAEVTTRQELTALLTALGIDTTTSNREGK